jgi:WD40 repeat protein
MGANRIAFTLVWLFFALGVAGAEEKPVKPFFDDTEGAWNESLSVSRDGKRLLLNTWTIWDLPTGKKLLSGTSAASHASAFSPDGKLFAIAGNYSALTVHDAQTGKVVWDLNLIGHGDTVLNHVEFTPDGQFLLSSSDNGILGVWDLRRKKAQAVFCFKSKYDYYANGLENTLRAWRAVTGNKPPNGAKTFVVFDKPVGMLYQFAISPDSKSAALALGTSELRVLELASGKVLKTFHTDQIGNLSVVFSGDGKLLVVGGADEEPDTKKCTIEVWDMAEGKRVCTFPGHRQSVLHLAISPDNRTIVSGGMLDGVRVWDLATGKQKYALHQEGETRIAGVAILPDGKTLLTAPHLLEQPVCFWDLATGKPVSPIQAVPPK